MWYRLRGRLFAEMEKVGGLNGHLLMAEQYPHCFSCAGFRGDLVDVVFCVYKHHLFSFSEAVTNSSRGLIIQIERSHGHASTGQLTADFRSPTAITSASIRTGCSTNTQRTFPIPLAVVTSLALNIASALTS